MPFDIQEIECVAVNGSSGDYRPRRRESSIDGARGRKSPVLFCAPLVIRIGFESARSVGYAGFPRGWIQLSNGKERLMLAMSSLRKAHVHQ
jgi:hypothetical protein